MLIVLSHEARVRGTGPDWRPPDQPSFAEASQRWTCVSLLVRALVFSSAVAGIVLVAGMAAALIMLCMGYVQSVGFLFLSYRVIIGNLSNLTLVGPIIMAYAMLVRVVEKRKHPFELSWRRAGGLAKGATLGVVAFSAVIGVLALVGAYRVVGTNYAYRPWWDLLMLGVAAPVVEEIVFRGVLLRLLEGFLGSMLAVVISALVFGGAHFLNPNATLLGASGVAIVAGVPYGAVYLQTRSLWWTVGLHAAWNFAEGPLWGTSVSGSARADGWLRSSLTGSEWLTGGVFGPEASVVSIVLLGALACVLLVSVSRRGAVVSSPWARGRASNGSQGPHAVQSG